MLQEREWTFPGGSLYYQLKDGRVCITRFQGMAAEVVIPKELQGCPVCSIEKKAFLSKKHLRSVRLPEGIEAVGDWAFAHCDSLSEVIVPVRSISFGKAVFKNCRRLEKISCDPPKEVAWLLAAGVTVFDADYLLDIREAGSPEWLAKWDARLKAMLDAPETEGYSKQVLCGEEDYGSTDLNAYKSNRRKERVRMAFLRLLHPMGCPKELQDRLKSYLVDHTKGCPGEEAWQVIREERGTERDYYTLFADLGCLTAENRNAILADLGEDYPEMKAYFVGLEQTEDNLEAFFGGLEL